MADSTKRIAQLPHLSKAQNAALAAVLGALNGLAQDDAQEVLDHAIAQMSGEEPAPLFARCIAGPLGKLTCDAKTKIDELTHELWLQHCSQRGQDTAGVLRDCIYVLVHGKSYRQMVVEKINHDDKRIEALAQLIGPFGAPESMGGRKQ